MSIKIIFGSTHTDEFVLRGSNEIKCDWTAWCIWVIAKVSEREFSFAAQLMLFEAVSILAAITCGSVINIWNELSSINILKKI